MGDRIARGRILAGVTGLAVLGALLAGSPATAEVPTTGLLASYDFSETSGTVLRDGSGAGRDATVVGGEDWHAGYMQFDGANHVKLPDGILQGQEAATIVIETSPENLTGPQFLWNLGGSGNAGTGQFFVQPVAPRLSISKTNWSGEQTALATRKLAQDRWQSIAATISRNGTGATSTLRLYVDGELWAEKTGSTVNLADLATHTLNSIGKSAYTADALYRGKVSAFRIYDTALTATQLGDIAAADAPASAAETVAGVDLDAVNEQDLARIESDLVLPAAGGVTWTAEPAGVIAADGTVTQPATDTDVTLTATAEVRGQTASRTFDVTVLHAPSAMEQAQKDLAAVVIPGSDDIRGSIALPETGSRYGSVLTWSTDRPEIIDVDGDGGVAAGVVTRPAADTPVTLTATATNGAAVETREIELLVRGAYDMPETTDYLFAHFTGTEGGHTDEQIYFATSQDGATFTDTRPNGSPVLSLAPDEGDGGVRDPFLVRSPEGDRFYLIATDLSIYHRGGWGAAQATTTGSTKIVVWESHDLVNWSEPRLPDLAGSIPGAGMMWAPEAFWDETTQQYYLYWATRSVEQNTFGDPVNMYIATTRDFVTFSEPHVWIDRQTSIIDTTMFKVGDWYYRASGDGQITIEKSKAIDVPTVSATAPATGSEQQWVLVGTLQSILGGTTESCGTGRNYSGGCLEGPEFFRYNDDDRGAAQELYGLMADQYAAGKGYLPFRTTDPGSTSTADWSKATDVDFGVLKKRHGAILPITQREYERVMYHYAGVGEDPDAGPELDATVSTRCAAGKVLLAASVRNDGDTAADVVVATAYGTKTLAAVAPGGSVSAVFTTRATSIAAGTATVTGTDARGATELAVSYAAASCG
ncbi:immunoglobulin-like domain-containing protein [Glycomyces sp. YM15]|uniref:immunoglobulin-like domain-containing protein n=1 Tax=Glycomyces sp. YM15 TaxID=2800446 RepID=UPI0019647B3E|nr:immunoglobulin-like domain-containing protein [Glycomyces sp. YM15]